MSKDEKILQYPCISDFIRCCNDGWEQGWHERNGGNLTYRLNEQEIDDLKVYFTAEKSAWIDMGVEAKDLANSFFITTGSGKFFRNVILNPSESIGIVQINDSGSAWRIVWGLENGGKPTSEFPSHFMNHAVRYRATKGNNRVIYHAHTTHLIAMTFVLPLNSKEFSLALWKAATECVVVFPEGIGVIPWLVPGGANIALETCKQMEEFQAAIWSHHGLFCSGETFDETFGLMHTIEKAAQIWILARAANGGQEFRQSITNENLREIAVDFNVAINEELLQ